MYEKAKFQLNSTIVTQVKLSLIKSTEFSKSPSTINNKANTPVFLFLGTSTRIATTYAIN